MYPIKLTAPLKDYIWGGQKLKTDFNKESELEKIAESWELSCHKDGESVIANGEYKGKTLRDFLRTAGKIALGENCERFEFFPILIKLIDAADNLSVQVHPSNEYAMRVENEYGKTEMWYIVDCDEGASLIYGFKRNVTKEELETAIEENSLSDIVNHVPVKKGDVFFIEAGTLHAIGKGIVIAEIQQNSNTTYRVYDYGRVGADGKPRPLHVAKALEVTSLTSPKAHIYPHPEQRNGHILHRLPECEYFSVEKLEISEKAGFAVDNTSFHSLLCIEGSFRLESGNGTLTIEKGDSVFLQANYGDYILKGRGVIIKTEIPPRD